jgi:(1->4)-alpha-D-glucan 1-alpha-D-glucosylmutase
VGGDSNGPGVYFGVEDFHRRNLERHQQWPHTMNATSTHDSKRSEDVRARIDVLSEFPDQWRQCLQRWMRLNPSHQAPDASEQIFIYQSLLGAWPVEAARLKEYVTKALREAKTHTTWINVNEGYEASVRAFIDSLYAKQEFLDDFSRHQRTFAYFGALSSLAQVVLKITSPGVPDFYRGTELWKLSLVDPDNRRPVDFARRAEMLKQLNRDGDPQEILRNWDDGRLKMYVSSRLLAFRRQHAELFLCGDYIPLRVEGTHPGHVIAFARRFKDEWCVTVVPRLCGSLTSAGSPPFGNDVWHDTKIEVPDGAPEGWTNLLTGSAVKAPLYAAKLFESLPVAVLST